METRRLVLTLTGIAVVMIVVLGGLGAILLASGGGDDNGTTAGDGDEDGLGERVEGELRLFGPDPITLDPACASDAGSAEYIVEIFSGLVSFDLDLNLIPDIAEDLPEVSDDGTVYTFHLRSNVLFHDNSRPVTADDFKYSLERSLNPDTQSTVGEVYLDDLVGAAEFIAGNADEVSGIRVIDPQTLELTITEPSAVFVDKLTYPTAYVVDQREVGDATCFEGGGWTLTPNGTGPFKLEEWDLGRKIVLTANPRFHLEPAPALERVTFILSGGSSFVMYENDEIDITGIGSNNIESVRDPNSDLNADLHEGPSLNVFYIGFNTQEAPFDDADLRNALSLSIDRNFLAREFLLDLVVPAKGILPPGMDGYNEALPDIPFDPDAARDLLEKAGGAGVIDGATILTSGQGATPSDILQVVLAMWEQELGITVSIEQEDFGLFLRDIDDGKFQMFSLGWIADYPDPQNFLDIKLHSESANNEAGYSNPAVDALLDQADGEADEATRLELYQQAEELIVIDMPWAPLYHGKASYLVKPYVEGFVIPPFVIPNLRYVSISR
ncbi:MAG: peptide ABC transporter substrate-binding protein [Chloroflexi bacterium]|nr:peptide ABC transporter substrate-binding protein [Chloroflexota bacterium]MCI0783798.1 peptide ABC transporter substrate-binding protein [Chloroflexota bacterium]MCI0813495.1 peptide ABC transporter substrate-binding protein [Chloroflexota bacterium]MCI0816760.1 peptide ABC transporter substrate-binding protein [Chloroflexota bacterium]MCI0818716.1 peptide ABC transporter substrate-binding protein [Chloroflexota bacterium]